MFPPERAPAPASRRIALRVEVRTSRGTLEGVPRLVETFRRHAARGTFLFALGADHCGRTLLRAGPRGLMRRIGHRSVLAHHGARTLLYGTVLPGPDIGRYGREIMRGVLNDGHEAGIGAWDAARWLARARAADASWITEQMQRAAARFEEIFGVPARVHGAPGWQMCAHAYRLTQRLGFDYCSDTRGVRPFLPVVDAELIASPQIPTTLPTLEELLARGQTTLGDAAGTLAAKAAAIDAPCGHVYTVRAELDGIGLAPVLDQLLRGWRSAGCEFLTLGEYLEAAGASLPRHRVIHGCSDSSDEEAALQGPEFLA